MGRKFLSDKAERRRVKRADRARWRREEMAPDRRRYRSRKRWR